MGEHFVELPPHRALAGRVAFALDVGRILEQRQHAGLAVFGEGVQIEQPVVGGRGIDFEVAGMNDHAQRRVDGERHAIHQAVRDLNGIDGEGPDLETLARADLAQIGVVQQSVLFELVFDVGQGELRAPDRNVQLAENPGQGADVVFVPVGENDAFHPLPVFDQVGNIGNNNVDAQQFGFGKHQAGVDDDDIVTPAHGHAVHSELAQAAEGYDVQFSSWHAVVLIVAQADVAACGRERPARAWSQQATSAAQSSEARLALFETSWSSCARRTATRRGRSRLHINRNLPSSHHLR